MTRISLKEAYDNRDVIAQLVSLRDDVDELLNILKDIDPDGDLTNVVTKTGDQTIDGVKTFIGKIVADCDIIQNGSAYETHAEQLYTHNDYIVTRDGALGGLQPGEFSGFRVNKYDSVHDGHLVMDMNGVARVGDVNDEQPLATRDEAASMTSGALVKWDGVNQKIIAPASNVGNNVQPVKIVNGEPVAIPFRQASLTANSIPGLTLTWTDNAPAAHVAYRVGGFIVFNFSVQIQGTMTGTSNWYRIFDVPTSLLDAGENIAYPYFISSGTNNLLNGINLYMTNGQTLNTTIRCQFVGVII